MSRRALTLVAALALASVVLLVPTGAAPFTQSGTDSISDEVHLAPSEGPNGKYAVLNEDGEIELLFDESNPNTDADGVTENATTRIDDVFTITYTGPDRAKVWLTDGADDVRFYRSGGAAGSLEREENAVLLGPNATLYVGVHIDTRGDHDVGQADSFTVHAEMPDEPTPAPTPTPEPIPTESPEDTSTATPEPTETNTPTPEPTETDTPTPEDTSTATPPPRETDMPTPEPNDNGGEGPPERDTSTTTPGQPGENGPGGATPTATTTEATPTPGRTETATLSRAGRAGGGPGTQTPTETAGGAADSGSIGGQPTELSGFAQDPLAVVGGLALLLTLAYLLRRLAGRLGGGEPGAE